jgi:hypothetical protein
MNRFVVGLALCAAVGLVSLPNALPPAEGGQRLVDEAAKQEKPDPGKEFEALQKEWMDAQEAFRKAYQEAKTDEERRQVVKEKNPKTADFAERFLKLAQTYPDSPHAAQSIAWILRNARGTTAGGKAVAIAKEKVTATTDLDELRKLLSDLPAFGLSDLAPLVAERARKNLDHAQAVPLLVWVGSATLYGPTKELSKLYNDTVDLLIDRFVERKELTPLATWLPMDENPDWAAKHLRRLMEKNPDDVVKFNAKFGLASTLKNTDEAAQPEAEKLFQSIIDEAADAPTKKQLADQAKEELSEMKVRGLGKPAPEIVGDDLDSKAFKLSDYKGKVVLLDFWGFW